MACIVHPVASPLHDATALGAVRAALAPALDAMGAEPAELLGDVDRADPATPFAVLVLTGGTEAAVLEAWRHRQRRSPGEPLLVLAHPGQNSLPAALEAVARLQRDGARARIVAVGPGQSERLVDAVHGSAVWHRLQGFRLGLLGAPSDWLVASVPDAGKVRRRWGVHLVPVDLGAALERLQVATAAPLAVPVRLGAHHVHEPSTGDIEQAARFEPVLRAVVDEHALDAVTVRCFDLVLDAHTSGCLALSALNDAGVVAGCEGDVASTLGLVWAKLLTGQLGWMANPSAVDADTGVVELAHCTVPRSLVDGYDLRSHFESGLGVGIAGHLPGGPVTLLRLGGRGLEAWWCAEGDATTPAPRPDRCRTQLDVTVAPEAAAELLDHPLGNHLVMVPGRHRDALTRWRNAHLS